MILIFGFFSHFKIEILLLPPECATTCVCHLFICLGGTVGSEKECETPPFGRGTLEMSIQYSFSFKVKIYW